MGNSSKRINITISPDQATALDNLMEREGITLTEAVRRLIAYGDYTYQVAKTPGTTLILRTSGKPDREVILL